MRFAILCAVLFLASCDDEDAAYYADGTTWSNPMPLLRNDSLRLNPNLRRMPANEQEWTRFIQTLNAQNINLNVKTFTPTWTGFSANPSGDVSYVDAGGLVFMWFNTTGTSNGVTFTLGGIPTGALPAADFPIITSATNNGIPVVARANVLTSGNIAFSAPDATASPDFEFDVAAWVNSGAKGWTGSVVYPK